jgi:chromatin remodeling complex protein RSC6
MYKTDNNEKDELQIHSSLFVQFEGIVTGLTLVKNQIVNLQQSMKQLEKNVKKQMKGLKKEATKNKNKGNRKPCGFAKPSKVTKELCEFMNKTEGTEIARTEVTKTLVAYIKENKLENESNSKIIKPDNKLKFLLGLEEGEELTYFNIQKYMNKHFVKNVES